MKNFFGVALLIIAAAAIAYFAWDRSIKKEVRYSKPLTALVEHTFNPSIVQKPAEDEARLRESLQNAQSRISSARKPAAADQYTVQLCNTLIEVRQKRAEYEMRISEVRGKTYGSLRGGSGSEQTKKTIIDAMEKQQLQYEQEQSEYCQTLLRQIKAAE